MWSPLVGIAAVEARRIGTPAILSPHGMLDPWSLTQKAWKKRAYLALIERHTIAGVAQMLFTTSAERENAELNFALPGSAVIALGADRPPEPLEKLAAAFYTVHPHLANRTLLIFLGRLHSKKRPEAAIAAMPAIRHAIPEATLLMVGSGAPKMVSSLQALAGNLGLAEAVYFMGHLDGVEKWRALAASQLFILPSQQENFAIAAAEALHAGVPVVLTPEVAIWREIMEAGAGIAIESSARNDSIQKALAAAAVRLLADHTAHQQAVKAARDLAGRAYTWEASALAIHLLYQAALARTSSTSSQRNSRPQSQDKTRPKRSLDMEECFMKPGELATSVNGHPMTAELSTTQTRPRQPPSGTDKLRRAVWIMIELLLVRFTPTPLHAWRRWVLRAFGAQIGKSVAVYPGARIWAPWNIAVADGATIGAGAILYCVDRIDIGEFAIVSQGAHLCTASHDYNSTAFELLTAPIRVNADAWVAAEAFVGPGVTVGEGAVVGARAVVNRSVPDRAVVAGNPARFIGQRAAKGRNRLAGRF
jgi:acetyltransferase-like isoleucine patch superfamily enzyme/glycosyltransferase involved in cell wall biosynthesis